MNKISQPNITLEEEYLVEHKIAYTTSWLHILQYNMIKQVWGVTVWSQYYKNTEGLTGVVNPIPVATPVRVPGRWRLAVERSRDAVPGAPRSAALTGRAVTGRPEVVGRLAPSFWYTDRKLW